MPDLDLAIAPREDAIVVAPRGRLTMVSARSFREAVVAEIERTAGAVVIVDMSDTTFVDSSGLGALVACLTAARRNGGDLRLAAPSEQVTMVLALTNLDRVLRPRESVEAALDD